MLITMCYCLGDLDAVFSSPVTAIGVPFIQVFANGVKSNAGASVMTAILIVLSRLENTWSLVLNPSQGYWIKKEGKVAERMEGLGLVLNSLLWVQLFIL